MKYNGKRLRALCSVDSEVRANVIQKMKNERSHGIDYYYNEGINITIGKLSDLMAATGQSIDFFIDFEEAERIDNNKVNGCGNVVNSTVINHETAHLREILTLKEELLTERNRIIAMKDEIIDAQNKRYNDLLSLIKTDKIRTQSE